VKTRPEVEVVEPETHAETVARMVAARAEQGLPLKVEDPVALDKAAAIFNSAPITR
jgi:hypothetical protein